MLVEKVVKVGDSLRNVVATTNSPFRVEIHMYDNRLGKCSFIKFTDEQASCEELERIAKGSYENFDSDFYVYELGET